MRFWTAAFVVLEVESVVTASVIVVGAVFKFGFLMLVFVVEAGVGIEFNKVKGWSKIAYKISKDLDVPDSGDISTVWFNWVLLFLINSVEFLREYSPLPAVLGIETGRVALVIDFRALFTIWKIIVLRIVADVLLLNLVANSTV